ncbi:3607_t:CDS:2 [Acaulospora morrowiae]|uniref:3607_t:CDS:1 n=1 Tax=Acaulospora morrowiae TaxID=94023 RepID=A0A9N9AHE6_9GLOM|nr:3607_t:CDS:2 [Acaulospora morrowiae]
MRKRATNSIDVRSAKKKNAASSLNWLFESKRITFNISPITSVLFLLLLISIFVTYEKHKEQAVCRVLNDCQEKISWISVPEPTNSTEYLHLGNGAFVYRHIYMDEFEQEFNIIDPDISRYISKYNLTFRLRNDTEIDQSEVETALEETARYAHVVKEQKYQVDNGTFVDDGRVYVRWVNDIVRYGMFAGRKMEKGDVLGIYNGVITKQGADLEYAWQFNNLVELLDDNGEEIRTCIDGKYHGNYLRFANHRDANQNGNPTYVIYDDIWWKSESRGLYKYPWKYSRPITRDIKVPTRHQELSLG